MAGAGFTISMRGGMGRDLRGLIGRIADQRTFFAAASELMLDQTQSRFREQRGPDGSAWKPLAAATVAARGSASPILEVTGQLRGGIHAAPEPSRAVVRTLTLPYAAIHQGGGQAGRGQSVTIPARPYLGFGDRDIREIEQLADSMLLRQ